MKSASFQGIAVVIGAPPTVPPQVVTGWSDDDDAFKFTRRNDSASDKMGVDGKMATFLSADRSGEFTLKLFQTSPMNKVLMAILALQEGGPSTFAPTQISFVDTSRNDKVIGLFGYIKKVPDIQRGKDVQTQEWTIVVEKATPLFGDPSFVGFATLAAEGQ
jgi:hypothetical protein